MLLNFFSPRQTIADSGITAGMTDFHSHVLPGVDDGMQTVEQSLEVLRVYESLGVRDMWATPHIMEDCPNETETLRQRFAGLKEAYAREAGERPVNLHLAAEYMLDSLFMQRFAKGDLLPIIDGRHLLVETSYYNPPLGLDELLERIAGEGYTPVLAHPERYYYMAMGDYRRLRGKGVMMQLDIFSLLGTYGVEARDKSRKMLGKGYYALAGSDIHDPEQLHEFIGEPLGRGLLRGLRTLTEKQNHNNDNAD